MPRYDEPLPARPRRVLVAGVSGSGKTTLAGRVEEAADLPHTELDALFHGPGWTPREEFVSDVEALIAGDEWVTEWQYAPVRELLADRADLLVWLDLPFSTVILPRVTRRTLRRRLRREELWNGNVEPPLHTLFTDPEHVVRWSFTTRNKYRESVPALARTHPHLTVVRLRSTREVDHWIAGPLRRAVTG